MSKDTIESLIAEMTGRWTAVYETDEGRGFGRCAGHYAQRLAALQPSPAPVPRLEAGERLEQMRKALELARQFIVNGVEFGYIRMPSGDDPANDTLPAIEAALVVLSGQDPK